MHRLLGGYGSCGAKSNQRRNQSTMKISMAFTATVVALTIWGFAFYGVYACFYWK
jgi:hypothetical protein